MDIKLRKKHWTEWIVKRLSGNNEVDKETINFGLNNYANEHGSELLNLYGVRVSFLERKLKKAEQALNDIVKWDDELEDVWGDPGERANSALEHNASMDGF